MMEYPFKYLKESISVSINPPAEEKVIMDQFSTADRTKFSALKTPAKQQEFLWSRSALMHAGAHLESITYLGKKPITNEAFISLSHCQDGVSAAYSVDLEVGIDIETRRENLRRIAPKFTTEDEKKRFSCDEQTTLQFIWGIKESLFKLYGFGNVDFKQHLEITSFEWNAKTKQGWGTAWITQTCSERNEPIQCFVQTALIGHHYICIASHRKALTPFESERVLLREWTPQDASWLYELNMNPAVVKYTGDAGFTSKHSALNLIKTYPNYQRDGYGRWMAISKTTGEHLGWCGLKNNQWGIDLGFRFFESSWGKGIATECALITIEKAKELKLTRLIGRALSENIGSWKVLEKVGMQRYHSVPIEDFAEDFNIPQKDLESWRGQLLHMYKIDLR
jgi:RimJ/RimL family protein N-acetyltransferase/phosphopantetheinyl transferase